MRNLCTLLIICAGTVSLFAGSFTQEPSDADREWVNKSLALALDSLMPMELPVGGLVAFRSHPDLDPDTAEQYFVVSYGAGRGFDKDNLAATFVAPVGQSVQRQLLELHLRDRAASYESVLSRIAVRRVTVSARGCPALRERMDSLSKISIIIPERGLILRSHPVRYRFVAHLAPLRIDATISDSESPVTRWSIQTYAALQVCAGAEARSIDR